MSGREVSDLVHVYTVTDEMGREICGVSIVAPGIMEARAIMDAFALDFGLVRRHLRWGSYGELDLARIVAPRWTGPPSARRRNREIYARTFWTASIWFERVEVAENDAVMALERNRQRAGAWGDGAQ